MDNIALGELAKSIQFLKTNDIPFLKSMPSAARNLEMANVKLMELFNATLKYCDPNAQSFTNVNDFIDNFQIVQDVLDNLLEKADVCIDEVSGKRKKPTIASNQDAKNYQSSEKASVTVAHTKNILKPQSKFTEKPDNSNSPFIPKIKFKPNAKVPLDSTNMSAEMSLHLANTKQAWTKHPYEFEITNLEYPNRVFESTIETTFTDIDEYVWIDQVKQLESLCQILKSCLEISVDLEHHDYRSFQGFTCLMQISTREQDFIIDTIQLRSNMYLLNEVFTDPNIVKVFHGAEKDIEWLQKDFGIYVVNMFDTFQASNLLELQGKSYAYLLKYYCNVDTDKKYQLADWRIRPLSQEMIRYAQTDTHYLLFIYDKMRNDLLAMTSPSKPNLVRICYERSAQTCLKRYEKDIYDAENGQGPNGWAMTLRKCREPLNELAFAVYRAIHGWRDHIARKEDESLRYVLPNHMLFTLARIMPVSAQDLVSCCDPAPSLIRLHAQDLALLIENTIDDTKRNIESKKLELANLRKLMAEEARLEAEKRSQAPVHIRFEEEDTNRSEMLSIENKKPQKLMTRVQRKATSVIFGSLLEADQLDDDTKAQLDQLKASFSIFPESIPESLLNSAMAEIPQEEEKMAEPKDEQVEDVAIEPETVAPVESLKRSADEVADEKEEIAIKVANTNKKRKKKKNKKQNAEAIQSLKGFDYDTASKEQKIRKTEQSNDFTPFGIVPDEEFKKANMLKFRDLLIAKLKGNQVTKR